MENNIENAESIHESDNTELIGNKVMNRATQTIGGDNQFILELRDQDKLINQQVVIDIEKKIIKKYFNSLNDKYSIRKSGLKSQEFDIYKMIQSAYSNNEQKESDHVILGYSNRATYSKDINLESLLDSFPKNAFKILNQFLQKHRIFKQSVMPLGLDQDHNTISFDMQTAVFNGPFSDGTFVYVEQTQNDKPRFSIQWMPQNHKYFQIVFYMSTECKEPLYTFMIFYIVCIKDFDTEEQYHCYKINSDGNLGEKI